MANKPLKVGITGGIGVGKTLVSTIFSLMGVPVYDADSRAKWITNNHLDVVKEITSSFGSDAYANGKLNTRYIAGIVFANPDKTKLLNSIVHPKVGEDFETWVLQCKDTPYVLKEAALMYESSSHLSLDKIIVVSAPLEIRIKRIQSRDPQRSLEEINGIISKQLPEVEKIKRADYCILNDDAHPLIEQVEDLDIQLRQISKSN